MFAMVLQAPGRALEPVRRSTPEPGPSEIRLKVCACGVCRTDLHVVDGELEPKRSPITPGHEVVGVVEALGQGVEGLHLGDRVGAAWLGRTCGVCRSIAGPAKRTCATPLSSTAGRATAAMPTR
jgi:propanol-preferring alcohol dehydrogenase